MKSRGAIYARVSTEEQARDGYSIDAQVNTLKTYAQLYDIEIVKIYKDEGLSGKNTDRPQLQQLLKDAKLGVFDTVLVWKISRLSRNLKNLLYIVDTLDSLDISFISQSETFNTLTPVGKMTLQILGSIAEFERNTIIENIKLGLGEKAKKGEWLGGRVFGYKNIDKKLVVDEQQAVIVNDIFDRFIQGIRVPEITQRLNVLGIRTINGRTFSREGVKRILLNPIYCGFIRHRRKDIKIIKGIHAPIVSEEVFNVAKSMLKNSNSKISKDSEKSLLLGLLKCPLCNSNMVKYQSKNYRYYRCGRYHNYGKNACTGTLINAKKIEEQVVEKIKLLLKNSNLRKKLYDNLKIDEIFHENFDENLQHLKSEYKVKIMRSIVQEIKLDNKKIKDIILKNYDII